MNSKALLITLAHCLFFSTGIQASNALLTFEEMDSNANGYISTNESRASEDITNNFNQIDSNSDGEINITEFQSYMGKNRVSPPEEMETSEPGAAPY